MDAQGETRFQDGATRGEFLKLGLLGGAAAAGFLGPLAELASAAPAGADAATGTISTWSPDTRPDALSSEKWWDSAFEKANPGRQGQAAHRPVRQGQREAEGRPEDRDRARHALGLHRPAGLLRPERPDRQGQRHHREDRQEALPAGCDQQHHDEGQHLLGAVRRLPVLHLLPQGRLQEARPQAADDARRAAREHQGDAQPAGSVRLHAHEPERQRHVQPEDRDVDARRVLLRQAGQARARPPADDRGLGLLQGSSARTRPRARWPRATSTRASCSSTARSRTCSRRRASRPTSSRTRSRTSAPSCTRASRAPAARRSTSTASTSRRRRRTPRAPRR